MLNIDWHFVLQLIPWAALVAILGLYVADRLSRKRDRESAERAERSQIATEQRLLERKAKTVRADLIGIILAHCKDLRPILIQGAIDPDKWQETASRLADRVAQSDVPETLGETSVTLREAVRHEIQCIHIQRGYNARIEQRLKEVGAETKAFRRELSDHQNLTSENVAGVVLSYVPFIREFGDDDSAKGLEYIATATIELSHRRRSEPF